MRIPHPALATAPSLLDLVSLARSLRSLKQTHAHLLAGGVLQWDLLATSALVLAYSSLRDPSSSLCVFRLSPLRPLSAFLYNSLSRAFSISSLPLYALSAYNLMLLDAVRPDLRSFPFALAACAAASHLPKGLELHASVLKFGFFADVFVGNTLMSFYGNCGLATDARKVFDEMPQRDIVSWNTAISVFAVNQWFGESKVWFLELVRSGMPVNSVTVVSVLPACAALRDSVFGENVHGLVVKMGLDCSVTVGNAIMDLYGKCGDMESSICAFWIMREKNDVSWNSIISSLVHVGMFADALEMFRKMLGGEVEPNSVTISSLLPALSEMGLFCFGREVHGYSLRRGMDGDVFVSNSLVDMYAKCGCSKKASDVFFSLKSRNVVSWNAMIANFTQNGAELEAVKLVKQMQESGESPNANTFTNVLPACARMSLLNKGKEIHARSIRVGLNFDSFVSNALIDMYAKCGRFKLGRDVFDISEKDEVAYNALIVGYSQSPLCMEALHLFVEMGSMGFMYDAISFMGVLSACANMYALKQGKEIHGLSVRKMYHNHLFVANSLLDLYMRSGRLDLAGTIFDRISNKDVASWNSMILGYGMQGEIETAIKMFDMMKDDHVEYDHVSYIAVLSACSHGGHLERGKKYFDQMLNDNIKPTQMHFSCMVDLLGRAGLMQEAAEFIRTMPFEADSNVWGALLGACRMHGNLEMGRWAAEHLFKLKPRHSGYYILLSNMYAEAGRWDEANEIRRLMKSRKVMKNPGYSWVESGNNMLAFMVGGRREEPDAEEVFYCEEAS